MTLGSRLAYYLRVIARYVEKPSTLALRRTYFIPGLYSALDQPWIRALNIATVIDIGAHVGDFAFTAHPLFPRAQFYSFEPLPDCYDQMLQHLTHLPRHQAFNCALGNHSGELTLQRSAQSHSSSFLTMTEAHKVAFPDSAGSTPVTVRIERLDDIAPQLHIDLPLLIKMDVQGYEDQVLRGGERTVRQAALLIIETSFCTLYEGQPLFADIYRILTDWGFRYAGALDQLRDDNDGSIIQEDSLFTRKD
jgi:FkbM family methyltransferase